MFEEYVGAGVTNDWGKYCSAWKKYVSPFGYRERCRQINPLYEIDGNLYLCARHYRKLVESISTAMQWGEQERRASTWKASAERRERQTVYFIRCEGFIKIGISVDPKTRLRNIQVSGNGTHAPAGINLTSAEIVALEPGGYDRESELHKKFAALRVAGEWFTEVPELTAYIEALDEYTPPKHTPAKAPERPVLKGRFDTETALLNSLGEHVKNSI